MITKILASLNRYLLLGCVAAIAILIVISGFLWISAKAARAERDRAEYGYEIAAKANQTILQSLEAERLERKKIENLLSVKVAEQKRIKREAEKRIKAKDQQIALLRKTYENVNEYLNRPVPPEYIEWLRKYAGSGDKDN